MQHVVFVVHGMGKQAPGWSGAVTTFLKGRYKAVNNHDLQETVTRFVEINYDDIFTGWLGRWAKETPAMAQVPEIQNALGFLNQMDKDEPLYTHIADVVLFALFPQIATEVITRVRTQMMAIWAADRTAKFSILAHSLGTSVIHRTVATLNDPAYGGTFPPDQIQFSNLVMVANVSKVLTLRDHNDVYKTLVTPGPDGYCSNYWSIHHAWDVITMPWAFGHPAPWAVPPGTFLDTEVRHFDGDPNVHDFLHYLKNPRIHLQLLSRVSDLRLTEDEFNAAVDSYEQDHQVTDLLKQELDPFVQQATGLSQGQLADILGLVHASLQHYGVSV